MSVYIIYRPFGATTKKKVKCTLVQVLRLCTGTEALYRHWGSVQALRLCTGTEALYRHWGSVQALRLCTGTEVLYRHWGSVQVLRLCTGTEVLYRYWGSVQALRLCTGTEALYRYWGSVQALRLCTGRTAHMRSISTGIALHFHDHGTKRGWGVSVTLRPLFIPGKDPVPIVQKAGWAPRRSGHMLKISPPPGFNPQTIQPVASRYTDYVTRPTMYIYMYAYYIYIYIFFFFHWR